MSSAHYLPEPIVFFATHVVELAVFMYLAEHKRATYSELLSRAYPTTVTTVDWPLVDALAALDARGLVRHIEGHALNTPQFRTYYLTADGYAMARKLKQINTIM